MRGAEDWACDCAARNGKWFGGEWGRSGGRFRVPERRKGNIDGGGSDGRGRVIDQTSDPFYAALCVTPPPPEFLDKTRLMVVTLW